MTMFCYDDVLQAPQKRMVFSSVHRTETVTMMDNNTHNQDSHCFAKNKFRDFSRTPKVFSRNLS